MDINDDDDFYAPDEPETTQAAEPSAPANAPPRHHDEDLEEGEEEDEGADMDEDDSDIDIITERKDGTKAAPPTQSKYSDIRNIPQRTTSNDGTAKPVLKQHDSKPASGADYPAVATSKIDVDAIPIHKGTGKPITQVNIDDDLPENDKPWRKPGTDLSDYFNYGFDEFTWAMYAAKQDSVRGEYSQDALAQSNKKMMEEMQMMMMGGMPGAGGSMPAMPGMDGMPPEMQQMMQQMMASGMDPSQMDPSAMFAGMQGAGGNASGGQGGQNQNFGGGQGFGNNQGQDFGYGQGMGQRGNFRGGRGRRNW
ncbi:uncharacterized protein JN550_010532 [Neoarthrinium moseri]|uniref:uncharacterized protein n=1 Tax=Neoarthrinium moseri TaxID=1658444 RepID=UPI001FDE6A73|nr:uncharacterized protein JN550_010532 [Neoarthrinium moseri]KAI1862067.1 hypothetical protein JN550_010532 [Neoarthrinium moseri]